jgi:regulator of protease activity HflC (stomatin/prohibitin superfamily)
MTVVLLLLAFFALVALFVAGNAFKIIGQAEVMVIERLGRFHRIAHSGLNILIPFVERPRAIDLRYLEAGGAGAQRMIARTTTRIDLREQVLNFPSQPVITKDNVTIDIDAVLYYRIADPQKATYAVQNLPTRSRRSPAPRCATSSARWSSTRRSPAATRSTAACAR